MSEMTTNHSLIGVTDYDEASNLSTYLISHGWDADHAASPEEILADLEDGNYSLVVLDAALLADSEWSLEEYLEEIGPGVSVLVLTQRGLDLNGEEFAGNLSFLQHPYNCWDLRSAIDRVTQMDLGYEEGEEESVAYVARDEEDDIFLCDELGQASY